MAETNVARARFEVLCDNIILSLVNTKWACP